MECRGYRHAAEDLERWGCTVCTWTAVLQYVSDFCRLVWEFGEIWLRWTAARMWSLPKSLFDSPTWTVIASTCLDRPNNSAALVEIAWDVAVVHVFFSDSTHGQCFTNIVKHQATPKRLACSSMTLRFLVDFVFSYFASTLYMLEASSHTMPPCHFFVRVVWNPMSWQPWALWLGRSAESGIWFLKLFGCLGYVLDMFWIGLESLALCCWFGRCSVVCFFLRVLSSQTQSMSFPLLTFNDTSRSRPLPRRGSGWVVKISTLHDTVLVVLTVECKLW